MNRETPPILPAEAGAASNGNRAPLIQFDRYMLDLRRGTLRSGENDIDLRPKSFLLLRLLVENAGRLVSKDEIIAAVWADVTVTDDSLDQCVKELRRALGEDGERLVRTVPRQGYRLEAPTAFAVSGPPSDPSSPSGSVEPPADTTPERAAPVQRAAASPRVERRLAAILAADIAGYSRLMGSDEVGTLNALKAHRRERIDPTIARHYGRIVKTTGDGALVEFPSVVDAVACAVAIQRTMMTFNADIAADRRIVFRIGINVGDIIIDGGDIFGDGVNVAARLEVLCEPGGVCISRSANEQIRDKLPLAFADLGERTVKNVARPIGVFALAAEDIAALPEEVQPQPEPPEPGEPPVRLRRRRTGAIVAGSLVLAALLSLGLWRFGQTDPATAVPGSIPRSGKPAIAVLPFASPVGDGDYFADGMTDDVINALGRFSSQTVMSRNAVAKYRGQSVTPQQVGRDLSVQYILEGTVRRFGDQLRVTAELTDTDRGRVLWSGRFDDALRDVFAVQDRITTQVVRGLAVKVTQVEEQRSQAKPTESLEAYDYVLRARRAASEAKRSTNVDARALLRKAIELDPRYGAAYTGLGETYRVAVAMGWAQSPDAALKDAEAMAYKALNINDSDVRAHVLLGQVHIYYGRYEPALGELERATAINPNDADALAGRGAVLVWSGRTEEGIAALEAARRIDPALNVFNRFALALGDYLMGRYNPAIEILVRNVSEAPNASYNGALLAASYAQEGRDEDMARAVEAVRRIDPAFDADTFGTQLQRQADRERVRAGLRKAGL